MSKIKILSVSFENFKGFDFEEIERRRRREIKDYVLRKIHK